MVEQRGPGEVGMGLDLGGGEREQDHAGDHEHCHQQQEAGAQPRHVTPRPQ